MGLGLLPTVHEIMDCMFFYMCLTYSALEFSLYIAHASLQGFLLVPSLLLEITNGLYNHMTHIDL